MFLWEDCKEKCCSGREGKTINIGNLNFHINLNNKRKYVVITTNYDDNSSAVKVVGSMSEVHKYMLRVLNARVSKLRNEMSCIKEYVEDFISYLEEEAEKDTE